MKLNALSPVLWEHVTTERDWRLKGREGSGRGLRLGGGLGASWRLSSASCSRSVQPVSLSPTWAGFLNVRTWVRLQYVFLNA